MDDRARDLKVGFPRMHKEAGERRDFLPDLVTSVARSGASVVVEAGIGSGMGLSDADYVSRSEHVTTGSNLEAFDQDVVVTLRCPEVEEFDKVRPGATLVAMLHYPTRPARIEALLERGIETISLDGIVDDAGRRLVVNAKGVAWNGVEAAFDLLEATWPPLKSASRGPLQVLVIGIGTIGRHAVEAASKFGSEDRCRAFMAADLPGVVVRAVGRTVTDDDATMRDLFSTTDVLVDASQRDDPSKPLVPNHWLAALPTHAVICDLVVDPYLLDAEPPTVRSVEGIPRGNLDTYMFAPDHPAWCDTIPDGTPTEHRRHVVTCYSWPGVRPLECMELYGAQLAPLLEVLVERGGAAGLRADGPYQERALYRARLPVWLGEAMGSRHGGRGSLVFSEPS